MNLNTYIVLIPSLCMLVPVATMFLWLKRQELVDRRNPLTEDLLRLPGETLTKQYRDLAFDISETLICSMFVPVVGLIILLNHWVDPALVRLDSTAIISGLLIMSGVSWSAWRTLKLMPKLRATKRGLEGELATAQLLTPLLADGWQLFHDLPMKRSNIDHVLVGPSGIYAVETKYRSKRLSLKGQEGVLAEYDGNAIRFAGGATEHLPIQQAQAVAGELSNWLHGKLGQPVEVVPVVALPGWFVKTTRKSANGQAYVINPKAHGLFQKRPQQLEATMRARISAALRELAVRSDPAAKS